MTAQKQEIRIDPPGIAGHYMIPEHAKGLVLFVHGSGSSRFSPRNNYVAEALNKEGLATLLFDLLTKEEEANRDNVFDIPLLAERLAKVSSWVKGDPALKDLPLGYFGSSTGAAAALVGEVETGQKITAIVSRGGRPDMAMTALPQVIAPTLVIVGGLDSGVIELNEQAYAALKCEKKLEVVPGATHLFEEPGKLDDVIALTGDWFLSHMTTKKAA